MLPACLTGPHEDFGIKYNCENGGPAPEKLTNAIYTNTTKIERYFIADEALAVDLDKLGTTHFMVQHREGGGAKMGPFTVEVRLSVVLYQGNAGGCMSYIVREANWHVTVPFSCQEGLSVASCLQPSRAVDGHVQGEPRHHRMPVVLLKVIDEVEDYLKTLKKIYDFSALSALLRRPDFKFVFDGMHGVAGPYATRIFVQVL